ncbi:MAG TPA: hypothetical protein VEG30_08900 [Terriglobales bacterium]|nr:hypothetical protein [Terriglobales bacterium]
MLTRLHSWLAFGLAAFAVTAAAQETEKTPQVRINYLNVCNPTEAEQQEISTALARIPQPQFAPDFEISRGRSTMEGAPVSRWVRIRKDFIASSPFATSQYSISVDEKGVSETLVFKMKETKDPQVSITNSITGAASPASVLATDTPADRVRLERFGKTSIVLARCRGADQTAYEPLFHQASQILARYRSALGVSHTVPRELAALGVPGMGASTKTPVATKKDSNLTSKP